MRIARVFRGVAVCLLLTAILTGCALSPKSDEWRQKSEQLLSVQLDQLRAGVACTPQDERLLVYLGLAVDSHSTAFIGDVLLGQTTFATLNPNFASVVLSNDPQISQLVYPFATTASIERALAEIGVAIKGRDAAVIVLASSHGASNVLAVNIAGDYWEPVRPPQLARWLGTLGKAPTAVVLSACFSGSFIPAVRGSSRVVVAAAKADRHSFGCNDNSKNTYFVEALLGSTYSDRLNWTQLFAVTRDVVAAKEKAMGLSPPSDPQIFVPADPRFRAPLAELFGKVPPARTARAEAP